MGRLQRALLILPALAVAATMALLPACGETPGEPHGEAHLDRLLGSLDPGYVGDQGCLPCHADLVERHGRTNHGQSLTLAVATGRAPSAFGSGALGGGESEWIPSPYDGLEYRVETAADGTPVQRERLVGADGTLLHDLRIPIDLVIGSGNQTRSFLAVQDGIVTQHPLTWYSSREVWDMSPGYGEANDRFSRPIILQCLACHSDLPVLEPHTQNIYQDLPGSISCERCHGPGAEHANARRRARAPAAGEPDPWIVNPANLDRSREMATCLQCHLAGVTAYPDGEDPMTFRPGMALTDNRAVFVPELQLEDPNWVGIDSHPIRLARSACFQATEMTCLTCHVSHTPGSELPPDHYVQQCLTCHTGEDHAGTPGPNPLCSRPDAVTAAQARSGDCVSCHMSIGGTSDVPHVRFTDHWIQRRPGPPLDPDAGRPVIESDVPLRIVEVGALGLRVDPELHMHRSVARTDALRADALFHFYETMHRHPGYLPEVIAAGERAAGQDDALTRGGRLALARAHLETGEVERARALLEEAVERRPDDPWGYLLLGALLDERLGDPAAALPLLDEALRLQPRLGEARTKRAEVLYTLGRRGDAIRELETLLRDDPLHRPRSWFNLGVLRLEAGDAAGALEAFRDAGRGDPLMGEAAVQEGSLLLAAGEMAAAEQAFLRGVTGDPENPAAHGSLALLRLEQGRVMEAREGLLRVLELDPGNAAARQMLEQIGG